MSKTANNTHRRAMRTVTPAVRAGRAAAGAAVAAGLMLGGASAALADPQSDSAPQADAAAAVVLAPVTAPAVGIPAVQATADDEAEAAPALAPAAGTISIELPPEPEPVVEETTTEDDATTGEAADEAAAAEDTSSEAADDSSEGTSTSQETRSESSSSRSTERTSTDDDDDEDSSSSSSSNEEKSPSKKSSTKKKSTSSSSSSDSDSSDDSSSSKTSESSTPAPSAGKGSSILATARNGIGVPYVYGGKTTSGWDCSGFTAWVYAQHGVTLPHSAGAQAAMGTKVSASEARPGDLVYKPGHIGIYAGNGKFVDAGNKRVDTSERNIYSGSWTYIRIG